MSALPEIVFLGVAERASVVHDIGNLLKCHLIGLKSVLPLFFYPASITGLHFIFALRHLIPGGPDVRITIRSESRQEIGFFNIASTVLENPPTPPLTGMGGGALVAFALPEAWVPVVLPFSGPSPLFFQSPGRYFLYRGSAEDTEQLIGEFCCVVYDPPALTSERVAAIKSDPRAMKAVRVDVHCNVCQSKLQMYAALERNHTLEEEGHIWYSDLPDTFRCACGKSEIDLRIARKNLFGYLGEIINTDGQTLNLLPLYEKSTLNNIRSEFLHVLNSEPKEEVIQKFIENNPILLRQFPAERILLNHQF
jgi:hypothetical protein